MSRLLQINNHLKIINSKRYSFSVSSNNNCHGLFCDKLSGLLTGTRQVCTSSKTIKYSLSVKESLGGVRSRRRIAKISTKSEVYSDLLNVLNTRKNELSKKYMQGLKSRTDQHSSLSQFPDSSIENQHDHKLYKAVSRNLPRRKKSPTSLKHDSMSYGTVATNLHSVGGEVSEMDPLSTKHGYNITQTDYESNLPQQTDIPVVEPVSPHIKHLSFKPYSELMFEKSITSESETDYVSSVLEGQIELKYQYIELSKEERIEIKRLFLERLKVFQEEVQKAEMITVDVNEVEHDLEFQGPVDLTDFKELHARVQNQNILEPDDSLVEESNILKEFDQKTSDQSFEKNLVMFRETVKEHNPYDLPVPWEQMQHYNNSFKDSVRTITRLGGNKSKPSGISVHKKLFDKVQPWMTFHRRQVLFDAQRNQFTSVACAAGLTKQVTEAVKNSRLIVVPFQPDYKMASPSTYNLLINQNAKLRDLETVRSLYDIMKENKIEISYQTMAGYLECVGRINSVADTLPHLNFILEEMKSMNLELDGLFSECIFKNVERYYVLKAIQQVKSNYKPGPLPPPLSTTGELFEKLNNSQEEVIDPNPFTGVMSLDDYKENFLKQVTTELQGTVSVPSITTFKPSRDHQKMREKVDMVEMEWKESIQKAFQKKLEKNKILNFEHCTAELYPFLTLLPEEDYVDIILKEVRKLATCPEEYSPLLKYLNVDLGQQVYKKYYIEEKKKSGFIDKISLLYEEYLEEYNNPNIHFTNHRKCWHNIINQHPDGPSVDTPSTEWMFYFLSKIGSALYDIILNDLQIDRNLLSKTKSFKKMQPAVYTIYRVKNSYHVEEIKMNDVVTKLYAGCPSNDIPIDVVDMPMVSPPLPWLSPNHGGNVLCNVNLIRSTLACHHQERRLRELPPGQLNPLLDSINSLAACAWKINKPILDIAIAIYNDKGNMKLEIPPPQSELPPLPPAKKFSEIPHMERLIHRKERTEIAKLRAENWSLRSFELYRLSIANKFRDDVIWFPHNIDFRGRTYPTSPYLNHLGADIARGVLLFAKGRPLGPNGLDWLKIHLVNLTGLRKRSSNAERLAFAETLLEEIQDSADHPMTGKLWWQDREEPWQVLACCMEITNAIRSPDHTKYISHFPVHQDGSCNGLQHYAALGRDSVGAKSVNLCSYPEPQDVYSEVVELVEKLRKDDAEKGHEIAKLLEGKVVRKTIKQTVMTTVYGVTNYGAKLQIAKQLEEFEDIEQKKLMQLAGYAAEKTFKSIKEMFSSTRDIQEWLCWIALETCNQTNQPVEWVTPVGLPVIQPYFAKSPNPVLLDHSKVDIKKQKNGFPPNFIHSLDSTHMMLTALYCQGKGINFISVHDCFWTHACHVPIMNKITREQFVNLHKQPILENLAKHLVERLQIYQRNTSHLSPSTLGHLIKQITEIPARGDFDIEKVLDSEYFFN